jgi:hypothetical protein
MLFDLEEIAAERQPKVDSGDAFPVVEPAMGLKYESRRLVIGYPLSGAGRLGDQGVELLVERFCGFT